MIGCKCSSSDSRWPWRDAPQAAAAAITPSTSRPRRTRLPAADGEAVGGGSGEASGPEHQPEVVHSGKSFHLGYAEANARYTKGARCGGGDAPDQVLGQPDQHNEMQMGRDRVVTYGFRFPQGTLLIRCRADHVEVARTLK